MPRPSILKRFLEGILSIGASPSESESQRGGRRVFMLAFILATLLSIPAAIDRFDAGYTWVGVIDLITLAIPVLLLVVIATHPTSYVPTLHVMFLVILAGPVLDTAMFGGLLPSGLLVIFGLMSRSVHYSRSVCAQGSCGSACSCCPWCTPSRSPTGSIRSTRWTIPRAMLPSI